MKFGQATRLGFSLFAIAAATGAPGQKIAAAATGPEVLISSMERGPADGQILREIDDPSLGTRWLLMRSSSHPGGPGRLMLAAMLRGESRQGALALAVPRPVIRAGDRLIVSENTAVIDARFEAIALGPATVGSALNVRLKIGGVVLHAVATGPGQAAIQPGIGASR